VCGVIGIISGSPIVGDLLLGLMSLQHRGQDAAGIAVFTGNELYVKKGKGLVADVFHEIPAINGTIGVGHTRYPTAGSNAANSAHPFVLHPLAVVHNGNITNYLEVKKTLTNGALESLESNTDAEILSRILAHEYALSGDIFHAVEHIMTMLTGSFSVIVALPQGILAFRDPFGFRPLVIGKKNGSYCVASETVAFETLGYKRLRDVHPGEAVFIDNRLMLTSKIIKERPFAHCMFEWVYFARPDSFIDNRSVNKARMKLGYLLAKRWKIPIDVVIPVPDSARPAAIIFAETLGVKHREGLIKNRYIGRTFIMPTQRERELSVRMKLNPIMSSIQNRRVAVLDDSIVRGTTSRKIVQLLRDAGAKEVHYISTCPPIRNPCHYGIDFPTKEELIASEKTNEEICKEIGADSVTYQTIEDLKEACKIDALCMACLDGKYPSPISQSQMEVLAEQRLCERKE